jgi:ABC-type antimicrobial peptide transport system permease subunit
VVIAITMFICFFSLSSSMTGNLYEQCKEISVMRAIGCTKQIITKLYIYEAFILVVASSFSGVLIGTIVGWSISFQRSMFINLPTPFLFPYREFFFIFTVSIVTAIFSTLSPSRQLMKKTIPDIAKYS